MKRSKFIVRKVLLIGALLLSGVIAKEQALGKKNFKDLVNQGRSVRSTLSQQVVEVTKPKLLAAPILHSRAEHPFSELNQMTNPDLVDLLVTLDWSDIPGLFSFSNDSYEFFRDSVRYKYMIDALDERARRFNGTDDLGIPTLVEVLRAGSYLAWGNDKLKYLNQNGEFVQHLVVPIRSMATNTNISWENVEAQNVMKAMGYAMGVGVCTPEIITDVAPLIKEFVDNQNQYMLDDAKRRVMYQIGAGINHGLINVELYNDKEQAKQDFGPVIHNIMEPYLKLAKYGSMGKDYLYLIDNGVWWYGNCGLLTSDYTTIVDELIGIIDLYGKWEEPSLEALKLLTDQTKPYKDLNTLDVDAVKDELKDKLLPKFYRFDDGEFVFRCGADVTEKKVKQLYWALKEVRAQFYRYSLLHDPLETGNPDDSLTAIIYNSPDEYTNNNFLWGLSTNNGGMYIESWGTFFTYERTPQESIYTLEDLFRHELTHYLQARYQTKGMWGEGIYANDRLTWFEEGGAEFTSGASRLDGIITRLNMVEGLVREGADRMNLSEVLHATYSSGFTFYTYAFVLFHYLHEYDQKTLFRLIKACNDADASAFDAIIAEMEANSALFTAYEEYKKELINRVDDFENAGVNDDYFQVKSDKEINEVAQDIESFVALRNIEKTSMYSEYFTTYRIRGEHVAFSSIDTIGDWKKMDSLSNVYLTNLSQVDWSGYKTTVAYFTNYRVENGKALFDITFEGMLNPGVSFTASHSKKQKIGFKLVQIKNELTISTTDMAIEHGGLYSANGRELLRFSLKSGEIQTLNLKQFPVGCYFLRMNQKAGRVVQKIIIQ